MVSITVDKHTYGSEIMPICCTCSLFPAFLGVFFKIPHQKICLTKTESIGKMFILFGEAKTNATAIPQAETKEAAGLDPQMLEAGLETARESSGFKGDGRFFKGSLNATYFAGDQTMQIYGNFEGIPLKKMHCLGW